MTFPVRGGIKGIAVAIAAAAIPVCVWSVPQPAVVAYSLPGEALASSPSNSLCFPIPECDGFEVRFESEGERLRARLVQTAYIRDQRIALYQLRDRPAPGAEVSVSLRFTGARGSACVDAGPLTRVCADLITGYGRADRELLSGLPGTVERCQTLTDCSDARADVLAVVGHSIYADSYVDSLAVLWATRMGLNVALIDVANISIYSPVALRDFIKQLYDSRSAEHFGDGHLGFVVLVGDAFEDDNATRMVPDYDGYGSTCAASDHFYACLSGEDDFEDVMLGRIPVGNATELANYYAKVAGYTPVPTDGWAKSVLFLAGCYFVSKDDYVAMFDSLESYIPDEFSVSRLYRYDFPATDAGDQQACQAVIDSLQAGKLIALYSGDGDKWDWGGRYKETFKSSMISNLNNGSRLPIVLSISCSNGWFDNISQMYNDLGVDCLAERLLTVPSEGAIACVASSRETGGGASVEFAPHIIKAAFVNGSSFLGELMVEAKAKHLRELGSVAFVRQFNLFGDPCLNFVRNDLTIAAPDLVIRPYHVKTTPEFPAPGEPLEVEVEVWNASGVQVDEFEVSLSAGHPDSGGIELASQTLHDFFPWEKRLVVLGTDVATPGVIDIYVRADANAAVTEADEANNTVGLAAYVYPCEEGFPVKVGGEMSGHVSSDLNSDGIPEMLVTSAGTRAQAVRADGTTLWSRENLGGVQWFDGVEPSAYDLNGDGTVEAVVPIASGVMVLKGATGETIWKRFTDYPCVSPAIADLDGSGVCEILVPTYSFTYSNIIAFEASGSYRWTYAAGGYGERVTGLVVVDRDLDGIKDLIYGTSTGRVACLGCATSPPTLAWTAWLSPEAVGRMAGGDLERDGSVEIIVSCDSTLYVLDAADGGVSSSLPIGSPADLALGDTDNDGEIEIVCASGEGRIIIIDDGAIVMDQPLDDVPNGSPVLSDVDGDGCMEIIVATDDGTLRILDGQGTDVIAPIPLRGQCLAPASSENFDSDSDLEIVAGSADSLLFMLDLGTGGGSRDWPCAGGSPLRTNLYAQPIKGLLAGDVTMSGRIDAVGLVVVGPGASLTLERGTDLRFCTPDSGLQVEGGIYTRGSVSGEIKIGYASQPAAINEWKGITLKPGSSASLLRTRITDASTGIDCQASDVYISECTVTNCGIGIKATSCAPVIDNNVITMNNYGVSASGGAPVIVGNTITSSLYGGVMLSSSCSAIIQDNEIGFTRQGSGLSVYSSCPSSIRNNRFQGNSLSGIYLSNSSPTIDSCWVAYNMDFGMKISYYSAPVLRRTSIAGNRVGVGVYLYSNPILGDSSSQIGGINDIRVNTQYAIYNTTSNRIKAQLNWWGTDDPDPSLFMGSVDYSAFLVVSPAGIEGVPQGKSVVEAVHPNPFASSLRIDLCVDDTLAPAQVAVYDAEGRLVSHLAQSVRGKASVEWNGRDASGRPVASGQYFMSVRTRAGRQTLKIMLVR